VTRLGFARENLLRFSFLFAGAVWISMGIFALLPLLLRQTSCPSQFPRVSHARLIPIKLELPPDSIRPNEVLEPLPEAPVPPEPEIKAERPDLPEIRLLELEPPEMTSFEALCELSDIPLLASPTLEPPAPDLPQLQTLSLSAVSMNAFPAQSNSMNLKVNLNVAKAPTPGALARPTVSQNSMATKMRFGLNEVDRKPASITTPRPRYPHRAKNIGIEGFVTVHFLVDRNGLPRELAIVNAEPRGFFEKAVRETVPRWRFKPGTKAGRPVETWVEMTIRFELNHNG